MTRTRRRCILYDASLVRVCVRTRRRTRCTGQFNLDPNRVIDVVLECFERRLDDAAFFAYVLRQMGVSGGDLCHLLGFKFEIYQGRKNEVVPWSLYNLSAEMIKQELIELESLMLHVSDALTGVHNAHAYSWHRLTHKSWRNTRSARRKRQN